MNPLVATSLIETSKKIPWRKVIITVAVIAAVIYAVRKWRKFRENSELKKEAEESIALHEAYLQKENLSKTGVWYKNAAEMLYGYMTSSFWEGGGWYGCDQDGVYDIFRQLNTADDYKKLSLAFGIRDVRSSWFYSAKPMDLSQALAECLTSGEVQELRNICVNKGFQAPF